MSKDLVIALAGNPNCGKTSLFNSLTGSKQHVGNWPGVTVEKKEGKFKFEGRNIVVVDLPGTYSLGAYSDDEIVARDFILKSKPDVVINVIDSSNIERNLYLTMQILETGAKMVLALNMMDEARNKNIEINVNKVSKALNIPVVATIATKSEGIKELIREAIKIGDSLERDAFKIDYGSDIDKEIKLLTETFLETSATLEYPVQWTSLKLLEGDEYIKKYTNENENLEKINATLEKSVEKLTGKIGYEPDAFIIDKRYEFISKIVQNSVKKEVSNVESTSDKIDKWTTHRWFGIPIFALVMFLMYQLSMTFGNEFLGGLVDSGFSALGDFVGGILTGMGTPALLQSFITDGIIGGLGAVFVFTPMIFTMYFLIAILEDSGYMARAAYIMDKFMNSIGLHGKTAVSLIISSGCNVAGIMSTRTLDSRKDRMVAILINPFVSCSARLPVYALFAGAFFAGRKVWIFDAGGIIVFGLYLLGIAVAILMGKFLSAKVFKGEESYFVMELPPYRIPTAKSVFIHMWEKSSHFLKKMSTIILGLVIIVWVLSNLPMGIEPGTRESLIGSVGAVIAPIFKLAGFGTWQAGVALITGLAAKEAVVSTLGTVYAASNDASLTAAIQQAFTPLTSLAFMVMTLLYCPCAATIGAIRRETNSRKWAIMAVIYTCVIGWIGAVLVYQIGSLLGFK
ncbi:ferrous iron transport protein B [Clostridium sp. CM028]|uniref:ferrous iron transport protein B n=1 Tax=unclassified Clostridium TaxID=2614128 RepID=UPI001C0E5426|nr:MULTISPECIES: ferrous iron transport protein B [unclassified Clostridium]MBU3091678.1 ferrous iron transport protein B [Clostridium sp. CF011]MBW9144822.1 ferrous iron transport protein B [Clostridium sp. CM027]MBW9149290.1 ferrous iron transport protein B [Clostridium sp. CM028]UVE40433.1 ferrous iron transport protein B [Clostridium sp. CM027]WAG69389.1 ferrous iron transport protein B [Clostridium sp. CF011]